MARACCRPCCRLHGLRPFTAGYRLQPRHVANFRAAGDRGHPKKRPKLRVGVHGPYTKGRAPDTWRARRILLAGGLGTGFLYRSEEEAGCGPNVAGVTSPSTALPVTLSQSRTSSARQLTKQSGRAVFNRAARRVRRSRPGGIGNLILHGDTLNHYRGPRPAPGGYGPSRRGRYADAGSECRHGRDDPNRDLSCQAAPWRENAQRSYSVGQLALKTRRGFPRRSLIVVAASWRRLGDRSLACPDRRPNRNAFPEPPKLCRLASCQVELRRRRNTRVHEKSAFSAPQRRVLVKLQFCVTSGKIRILFLGIEINFLVMQQQ